MEIKDVAYIITIILGIVYHFHRLAEENKKNRFNQISTLIKDIQETQTVAIQFHCSESFDHAASIALLCKLDHTLQNITTYCKNNKKLSDHVKQKINNFMKAITLNNISESEFKQQTIQSKLCSNVKSTSKSLQRTIQNLK